VALPWYHLCGHLSTGHVATGQQNSRQQHYGWHQRAMTRLLLSLTRLLPAMVLFLRLNLSEASAASAPEIHTNHAKFSSQGWLCLKSVDPHWLYCLQATKAAGRKLKAKVSLPTQTRKHSQCNNVHVLICIVTV